MSNLPSLVLVEPSVAARRTSLARLRALNAPAAFDAEAVKKRLEKIREKSVRDSGWLIEDFSRAAKSRGIRVLVAKDERAAALYIRKSARGHKHLLINKSATVKELAPFLVKDGFEIVDTYDAEDKSGEAVLDIWRQWQLGEPEPGTIWESFDAVSPTSFTGKPLPAPTGRWAGVIGLSSASAKDGRMFFVQHTHNLSKILYSAKKLFIVAGIEKLAPKAEDALFQARSTALFGLLAVLEDALKLGEGEDDGAALQSMREEAGASSSAATPRSSRKESKEVVFTPHIPDEIHVILLDSGRRPLLRSKSSKIMQCISCKGCRRGCMMGRLGPDSPRDAALRGLATSPAETEKRGLYECTMCESCKSVCPLEIPSNEYNLALRKRLALKGGLPEVFQKQSDGILGNGNPFGEAPSGRGQFYPEPRPVKGAPVLLYLGCVASYQRQKIVESAFKLLNAAGTDFSVLGDKEVCCGYPLYVAGSRKFEEAARRNIDAIRASGARTVVTTCAGCNKTLRKLYAEHFDLDFEVLHLVEYLARSVKEGKLRFSGELRLKAVYHDPCDLGRAMGVYEPPRELLAAIPGLETVEFRFNRGSSRCCGAGGGAKGYDNALSEEHAFQRMREAVDLGADVVTSACPACLANLQIVIPRIKKETKKALRFMDLSEMAARALEPK
jgi:Fe-S oxidoreductase